jgi:hypothetical protein
MVSQCGRTSDGTVRAAWMENIMSNKINFHHTAKNQQERVQLDEAALTESELHNVVGGDYAQTMMVWFNLLGQMGFGAARPKGGYD